ncbi:MAG: DNA primase [Candidatus Omnitrophica bacterium]|nr:DNA primase [Candidatus Omnitrophota bacterium]
MPGLIPEAVLEEILSRVDIVELIAGYIPLKRAGKNFKAVCPFHHEKTPSFMVSSERQIYHCFGCGESGNAFKFLIRHERMEFPEAVDFLAKKTGVILPQSIPQDRKTVNQSIQLYKVNELACSFYTQNLRNPEHVDAKRYLRERGLTDETLALFSLGYAVKKWDALVSFLRQKKAPLQVIENAGLVLPKDTGGYYDRFRNRLIFPIKDVKSRVIGFGARVLDESLPKYINSPETPVYVKGKNLFGLDLAKEHIRDNDCAVIVEGYLDCIIPYQYGIMNVVASLGTALTVEQIRLLKRYTHQVVMIYDADNAGELATLRSFDLLIDEDMRVKVASLPQGFDPDTFVRQYGIQAFRDRIDAAEDLFDYKLSVLLTRYRPKDVHGKAQISTLMLSTIQRFKNAVMRTEYIKQLAQVLDIREEALWQEIRKLKSPSVSTQEVPSAALCTNPTERLLVKLMLEVPDCIRRVKELLEPSDFQDAQIGRIVSVIFDLAEQDKPIAANCLVNSVEGEGISKIIGESVFSPDEVSIEDRDRILDDCIQRIRNQGTRLKRQSLHEQIKAAQHLGDDERLQSLMREFHHLVRSSQ